MTTKGKVILLPFPDSDSYVKGLKEILQHYDYPFVLEDAVKCAILIVMNGMDESLDIYRDLEIQIIECLRTWTINKYFGSVSQEDLEDMVNLIVETFAGDVHRFIMKMARYFNRFEEFIPVWPSHYIKSVEVLSQTVTIRLGIQDDLTARYA